MISKSRSEVRKSQNQVFWLVGVGMKFYPEKKQHTSEVIQINTIDLGTKCDITLFFRVHNGYNFDRTL